MMLSMTAALAAIVLLAAVSLAGTRPGASGRREIARRPDWSDQRHRREVEEYRREQDGPRTRVQIALWVILAGLAAWMAIQLGL